MPSNETSPSSEGEGKVDRVIGKRWTQRLADAGWTPVVHPFLRHYASLFPVITPVEAMFIIHLMGFKWDARDPYPTFGTLAKAMGVSISTVRGYARSLEGKGYLKRVPKSGGANRFDLAPLFAAIEKVMPDQPKAKSVKAEGVVIPPAPTLPPAPEA